MTASLGTSRYWERCTCHTESHHRTGIQASGRAAYRAAKRKYTPTMARDYQRVYAWGQAGQ